MKGLSRFAATVSPDGLSSESACDLIARKTGLSKAKVKEAMIKGAVWIRRPGKGTVRLRRATAEICREDRIEVYYDAEILRRDSPPAECVADEGRYTVWHKPPGLLSEGTRYGDHCALLRRVEIRFRPPRRVFLVHRLDREASGLMLIAHDREAAAKLSALFRNHLVDKEYRVEVKGSPVPAGCEGTIDTPLDGKPAVTEYTVISHNTQNGTATLRVRTKTGRLHQIRRHFAAAGHPVIGDPAYGMDNKNPQGLRLSAVSLEFVCPFTGEKRSYRTG